jgi:hypothetical protein
LLNKDFLSLLRGLIYQCICLGIYFSVVFYRYNKAGSRKVAIKLCRRHVGVLMLEIAIQLRLERIDVPLGADVLLLQWGQVK